MIPKLIHQIHMGNSSLNEFELAWQESWREYNPDFEHVFWQDEDVDQFLTTMSEENQKIFHSCKTFSEKSDVLRFEIVNKFGGIYCDTDFECLKPIAPFIKDRDFVICRQNPHGPTIAGGWFASTPNHPILNKLVNGMPERIRTHGHKDAVEKLGPRYVTDVIGSKNALEPKYLYPYLWWEKDRANENFRKTCPEAYAVHHWRMSWKNE
jgi:mannosyltransferase OCH1-like enzyme